MNIYSKLTLERMLEMDAIDTAHYLAWRSVAGTNDAREYATMLIDSEPSYINYATGQVF